MLKDSVTKKYAQNKTEMPDPKPDNEFDLKNLPIPVHDHPKGDALNESS